MATTSSDTWATMVRDGARMGMSWCVSVEAKWMGQTRGWRARKRVGTGLHSSEPDFIAPMLHHSGPSCPQEHAVLYLSPYNIVVCRNSTNRRLAFACRSTAGSNIQDRRASLAAALQQRIVEQRRLWRQPRRRRRPWRRRKLLRWRPQRRRRCATACPRPAGRVRKTKVAPSAKDADMGGRDGECQWTFRDAGPLRQTQQGENESYASYNYVIIFPLSTSTEIFHSIVVSISACHAGDPGSIR